MLRKPTPIKLSTTANEAIQSQLNVQTTVRATPKSTDPINFPVFDIPTGKRVMVYVPNHVVDGENGPELRMDKPLIHTVQDGKRYLTFRCIQGITYSEKDENGKDVEIFDGSCPLCDGTSVPWDLANARIAQKCKQLGLDPEDKDNTQVKAIRSSEFSARVVKEANRYYTFPIVVIATVNDDGKTPARDEEGNMILTPMWYHISESQYKKKWETCFEGMEDEPTHPGGHFFTLSYVYDSKNKEPNKRDAAQNLSVISRRPKDSGKLKSYLDDKTKDWTPEKAQETVITNQLYSMEDLQNVAETVLMSTKEMLSFIEATSSDQPGDIATGFNLQKPEETKSLEASVPAMDETDEDDIDYGDDID